MQTKLCSLILGLALLVFTSCRTPETQFTISTDPALAQFHPLPAPKPAHLLLKPGDRLAICGDSITEQKMYSRLMEDYLTMCVPELNVTVRQYGWGGERAPGFLARMTNDCLRFQPTIATTCYGMNDHEYRAFEERIGRTYREKSTAIVEAFKAHGVRVIQGSPGCVGKVPGWTKRTNDTLLDLNQNLCTFRNIGIEIARQENAGFADVLWPMLAAGRAGQQRYGESFLIAGKDGVHPDWAGHLVMAYAFLKALGLDGEIGGFTVDLQRNTMKVSKGHELVSAAGGAFTIRSSSYPFCACSVAGAAEGPKPAYPSCDAAAGSETASLRSAQALVPFDQELNRFMLVAKNGKAANYRVTWGGASMTFTADQLRRGVNLVAEFPANPFSEAFARVDAAVAAKQAYETKQIKQVFHGAEGKADMEAAVKQTEAERAPLAAAIQSARVPVTHTITITAE
jgi:lysophospholipase L1-like esterase